MVNIDGEGPKCVPCEVTHAKLPKRTRWYCGKCGDVSSTVDESGDGMICSHCKTSEHMKRSDGVCVRCGQEKAKHTVGICPITDTTIPEGILKCPRCGGAMDEEGLCATPDCEPVRGDADCAEEASRTPVLSNDILHQLCEAGVIDSLDQRVIIDLTGDKLVKIYTQRYASKAFLDVLMGKPILVALAKAENVGDESCRNTEKATA